MLAISNANKLSSALLIFKILLKRGLVNNQSPITEEYTH